MSDRMGEDVARNAEALADEDVRLPSLGQPTGRRFLLATEHTGGTVYTAEWWCAWCPTSHPNEAAMRKHAAVEHPNQLSTSARLRQLQQDLAASQADLTRVVRERDTMREVAQGNKRHVAALVEELDGAEKQLAYIERERDEAQQHAESLFRDKAQAEQDLHLTRAELASARAELEQLRAELAAHPDGGERP